MHGSRNVTSVVVFTDLDGSLLNEHDYGYEEALPALARIRAARAPLVFVTSKTRREVERLQAAMDLREPFVVENGGGIFFPVGYDRLPAAGISREGYGLVSLGRPYGEIRRFFQAAQARFDILGFGDMSVRDIADLTDLPVWAAGDAKERDFTEPFLLSRPDQLYALEQEAQRAGLAVTRGGRFHHLMDANQDKGKAVRLLTNRFRRQARGRIVTVGLGDSANDLPMLREVDVPLLLRRPDPPPGTEGLPRLDLSKHPGSRGWNEAVNKVFDDLHL